MISLIIFLLTDSLFFSSKISEEDLLISAASIHSSFCPLFKDKDEFRIAIAPEGTRKKVEKWKTGFYYIAKKANVPIVMFTLDFANKENKFSEPFYPTDDTDSDFKFMTSFFEGVNGKVPSYS